MERQRNKVENYSETNTSFPNKLYALMLIEEGNAVEWCTHGFAFKITDQNYFLRHTIPKYFRHTKLTSFQRQLNLYGFRRVLKGEDEGAYFHPKFQRGKKELIPDIQRLPAKQSLVSLQEIMDSSQQASSVQGSSSSRKKKTSRGSPKLKRKTRGKAGSVSSSSEEPEEPEQQETAKQREIPICLFMNSGRPKRQVQVAAESAHNNALQTGYSSRARGSHRNDSLNPAPQSSNGANDAKDTDAHGQAKQAQAAQAHSPLSSIHSTSTDGESSGGDHHHHHLKRHRHHHRHPRAAHKDLQDPTTPLNQSFGSSSSTHVPHLKMPSYDETHDDILDLSLTSPLFANEMMMDAPSTAKMYSPTALAKAAAQAGFDSVSAVDCQHTTDFAGLGSTQQDLSWSSNYYSLGALGRLPLITDYSPKVNNSNPCLTISGSSASASAQSSAPKHISYIAQQAYEPMMRSAQSVPALLHTQHAQYAPHNAVHMQHAHSGPKLTFFGTGAVSGAVMTGVAGTCTGGSAGAVLGVGEPSGIWLGDPLDDLLDFFEPSPEATMTGTGVGFASTALPAFPASGLSRSGGAGTEANEVASGSGPSVAPVGAAPAGTSGGVNDTGPITG